MDIRKLPRVELLNDSLVDYAFSKAGVKGFVGGVKKNAIGFMRKLRGNVKIDMNVVEITAELLDSSTDIVEQFVNGFDTLERIAKEIDETFYVVLDEFQDIELLEFEGNILEVLRATIQHHENVCYVFLGSKPTLMTKIFENKKSPFYNFSRKLTLLPFENKELVEELNNAFKRIGVQFESKDLLPALVTNLGGHPANTMLVMQNIELIALTMDLKLIKEKHISQALMDAYSELDDLLSEYISEIKKHKHLYDVIYRLANKEEQVLEPSSLHQKMKTLEAMGHIDNVSRGEYRIIDGFFEAELRRQKALFERM